jgi:hypothetical protein
MPPRYPWFDEFEQKDDPLGPSARPYLYDLKRHAAADDEWQFVRTLAVLWNETACYEMPVRTWSELQGVPVGVCPNAATGDELAALVALLTAVYLDFKDPPKPRRKKPTPSQNGSERSAAANP